MRTKEETINPTCDATNLPSKPCFTFFLSVTPGRKCCEVVEAKGDLDQVVVKKKVIHWDNHPLVSNALPLG